jgi:hypothetical protein
MVKLFSKLLLIGGTVFLVAWLYFNSAHKVISYSEGPSTRQQIYQSVDQAKLHTYELVLLGNSRIYRGLNPDKFSQPAYNFAHDNDSYNQIYYKLLYLRNELKKPIHSIVLGVDYFSFSFISDTRNYVYGKIFPPEYLADYDTVDNYLDYKNHLNNKVNEFLTLNYTNTFFVFLSSLKNKILGRKTTNLPFVRSNGQFIKPGTASLQDKAVNRCRILDIQKKYFEKLMAYARQQGIAVLLVMPPSRPEELANFSAEEKSSFDQWIQSFAGGNVQYVNYSTDHRFGLSDFTDITHLNEAAADRFSSYVNEALLKLLPGK